MTIKDAYRLINDGTVEATACGLNAHFACWFIHDGVKYMLSEIKGHAMKLWALTVPNTVIDEISLCDEK